MYNFEQISLLKQSDLFKDISIGASHASSQYFPKELKVLRVDMRNPQTNQFLGSVTTRPRENLYAIGLSYIDLVEGAYNEDMIILDLEKPELKAYYRGKFESSYPIFEGCHKGDKSYLLDKSNIIRDICSLLKVKINKN